MTRLFAILTILIFGNIANAQLLRQIYKIINVMTSQPKPGQGCYNTTAMASFDLNRVE